MKNYILLLFYLILSTLTLNAQFILNGNASKIDEDCFELTPDALGQSGSAWFEEKIPEVKVETLIELGCEPTVNNQFGWDCSGSLICN